MLKIMLLGTLIGNLGADAHKIEGVNFAPFYSLSIAHTEKYTDKNGTQCERTIWVNAIINWNCEKLLPYLQKGQKVYVSGPVRLRAFKDKDGNPRAAFDINVTNLELCGANINQRPQSTINHDDPFADREMLDFE